MHNYIALFLLISISEVKCGLYIFQNETNNLLLVVSPAKILFFNLFCGGWSDFIGVALHIEND